MALTPMEFRASRLRLLVYLVGAVLFVAIGVFLIGRPEAKWTTVAAGFGCVLFFGLAAILFVLEIVRPRLIIRLDERGIDFRSGLATPRIVLPWSEIVGVRHEPFMTTTFVHLELRDPDSAIGDHGSAKAIRRTNEVLTGSAVPIDVRIFGVKPERLVQEIEVRLREYGGGPQPSPLR